MKNLKELFDLEIRSSMLFMGIGISMAVGLIVGFFQFQQLRLDFNLTEHFVEETTKNALALEQPIMVHRSISEFWKAFEGRLSAITGLEVYFDDALVSQNGIKRSKASLLRPLLQFESKRCFPSSQQNICVLYFLDPIRFLSEVFFVLLTVIVSAFSVYVLRRKLAAKNVAALAKPLEMEVARISRISEDFKNLANREPRVESVLTRETLPIQEVFKLSEAYKDLLDHSQRFLNLEKSVEVSKSLSTLAAQVSHDIRSPLSALNMVMGNLPQLPEDKRVLIRNSVQRINDIANSLLEKGRSPHSEANPSQGSGLNLEVLLLGSLIDSLVSEKRIQFRDKLKVEIVTDIGAAFGVFAKADPKELKRILSNLINNSVEAFGEEGGKITVSLRGQTSTASVVVSDSGKGMPEHIVARLMAGEKGVSHGKEGTQSGSGIGIHHAKAMIESFGGKFEINTRERIGTMISMTLQREIAPKWFVERIEFSEGQTVIALDDDQSIHNIWQGRYASSDLAKNGVQLLHFSSNTVFEDWLVDAGDKTPAPMFLMDYELLGQNTTGLDLIEKHSLGSKAILVTSRYEEKHIRERCERLGVRLLPKSMAGFVAFHLRANLEKPDVVLIDDDDLVHMSWEMSIKNSKKSYIGFRHPKAFFDAAVKFDRQTVIYVDSNLGSDVKGEDVAKKIFEMGFETIYLCTGYGPEEFPPMPWIKAIVGKDCPLN